MTMFILPTDLQFGQGLMGIIHLCSLISWVGLEALIIWGSLTHMSEAWSGKTGVAGLLWHLSPLVASPAWIAAG